MTTYFVGGECESVVSYVQSGFNDSAAAGAQSGFNRGGIYLTTGTGGTDANGFGCFLLNPSTGLRTPATGTIWTHWGGWMGGANNTSYTLVKWVNSAGTPVFRIQMGGNNLWQAQFWTGSAWTNLGSTFAYNQQNFSAVYDAKMVIGASGNFRFLVNNFEVVNVNLDTSSAIDIARMDVGTCGSNDAYFHSIIIANYSTIGHTVRRRTPSANGTNVAWVGTWDGVDEFGIGDSDGISVGAVGAKETFGANALSATASGAVIKAVAIAARVRVDDDAVPKNIKAVVRVGTTDYESPNMVGTNYTYRGVQAIFEKDPSTGADWINIANVNGEFGLKSDT